MIIPCKDCLIYARCNARIHRTNRTINGGVTLLMQEIPCPQLKKYLGEYPFEKINDVREVFNLYRVVEFDNDESVRKYREDPV